MQAATWVVANRTVNTLDSLAHTHPRGISSALRRGTQAAVATVALMMLVMAIPAASAPIAGRSPSADGASFDPGSIEDFYTYDDRLPLEPSVTMLDSNEWYQHYDVQYQSEGDTVYAHYFVPVLPRSAGNPVVIGLHGMFSGSDQQFWAAAQFVAKRGIAGFTPSMPYHHRRSKGVQLFSGQKFILDSPQAIRGNIRRAVIDVRRAVDWLSRRPEINPHAVSIAGASLGGIVASLSYKVEPRLRTGVFVMAGSGVSGIAENSEHPLVAAFREVSKARLLDPKDFVEALRPVDPINVPDLYPRPVLMINGTNDNIMPPSESVRLRRSLGQAKQVWADSSHYFPAYPAAYLLASFLAEHMPESFGIPAPGSVLPAQPGWRFVEHVQTPIPGDNRLWVRIDAQAPAAGASSAHRVGVPMINKIVPVIVVSNDTLRVIGDGLLKLPAFIYVTASDSLFDFAAACAYASALGLGHDPLLYYITPNEWPSGAGSGNANGDGNSNGNTSVDASAAPEGYALMEFSIAHTELARPATAAVVLTTSSAPPAASLPSPRDLCTYLSTYSSASAAVAALSSKIRWDKLKTVEHFYSAPDEWPIWSYSPPNPEAGDTGNSL